MPERLACRGCGTDPVLPQDTRMKDAAGGDIVNIFGGIKWGWRLRGMP